MAAKKLLTKKQEAYEDGDKGVLPYASELFGVYMPLSGWTGNQGHKRLLAQSKIVAAAMLSVESVSSGVKDSSTEKGTFAEKLSSGMPMASISMVARGLQKLLSKCKSEEVSSKLCVTMLKETMENLDSKIVKSKDHDQERAIANVFRTLAEESPGTLHALLLPEEKLPGTQGKVINPAQEWQDEIEAAGLYSPIALVHLYRQYFFELGTFSGPPVGHVWVSPGGSLEVYEVQTRKSMTERSQEAYSESLRRTESTTTEQDELATIVRRENLSDTKLGVTASGGANWGVYQAQASAEYSLATTLRGATEEAHKHMRQQSERISTEMKQSFKSTFKTTLETTNLNSRRYVIMNTTKQLQNYELLRKMRRVGVQVQHVGTQLCWQVYLRRPGTSLGVGQVVHVPAEGGLANALDRPQLEVLKPIQKHPIVGFQYRIHSTCTEKDAELSTLYSTDPNDGAKGTNHKKHLVVFGDVFWDPPPEPGYVLSQVEADNSGDTKVRLYEIQDAKTGKFGLTLGQAHWHDRFVVDIRLTTTWIAGTELEEKKKKEYEEKLDSYEENVLVAKHQDFIGAVRERVKLAGEVEKRRENDLREEERTTIYREVLRGLVPPLLHDVPVELMRALFDTEKLLYFVAPTWWSEPLYVAKQQVTPVYKLDNDPPPPNPDPTKTIQTGDLVAWGGTGPVEEEVRHNYYITDDSVPAPMGASLGWLIQLDGDDRRNAFLNSPWVKAVLPIRPGNEERALQWLKGSALEGDAGLNEPYGKGAGGKTKWQALLDLAKKIAEMNFPVEQKDGARTHRKNQEGSPRGITLPSETVYESGFEPLQGGFSYPENPFELCDSWIEILPTDQIVAEEWEDTTRKGSSRPRR